jgi:hypothetical protein
MNRKISLLTVALLLTGSIAFAQFNLGPKIGINSSRLTLEDNVNNVTEGSASFGFHAGLFARLDLNKIYLQPELLYTNAGGEIDFGNGGLGSQIQEYEFNRIDVPIHVGFRLGEVFRIGVAPVFSILTSDNVQGNAANRTLSLKNSTVGYQAGIGVDVWNIVMDLRYEGNLSGVTDELLGASTDQRLNQITFAVGLKIF